MDAANDELVIDPSTAGFQEDPYAQYAVLRARRPVHHDPRGPWMVFRYDDVRRVLRGPGISSRLANAPDTERTRRLVAAWGEGVLTSPHLSRADPPEHTRLRRLLAKAFTPRNMDSLRPRIREIIDQLLGTVNADEVELTSQIVRPLPYRVMCEFLGFPLSSDDSLMIECAHAFVMATMEPFMSGSEVDDVVRANQLFTGHIREAVQWKRKHLDDDLMSLLLTARDKEERLSEDELVEQVRLLFAAGHETTVNAIGLAFLALLRHPDQWDLLVAEPRLVENGVEELLRYDSTIQIAWRTSPDKFELESGTVPAHNDVVGWVGSANRDPAKWGPTADELDLRRPDAKDHLSFGNGIHLCLGAWLARAELQELLRIVTDRYPATNLVDEPLRWKSGISVRGLERLRLRLAS
jgi:cytochrome P450